MTPSAPFWLATVYKTLFTLTTLPRKYPHIRATVIKTAFVGSIRQVYHDNSIYNSEHHAGFKKTVEMNYENTPQ